MADSKDRETFFFLHILVPTLISLPAGLLIHSFIIYINVNDWWKGRSVTPTDHIVTSLAVSRMCAQCVMNLYFLLAALALRINDSRVILMIIGRVYVLFTYANIWLTSLLSIVFCLKISNLRTRLFLYLRRVMLPRTGHFIAASGLLSAFNTLFSWLIAHTDVADGGTYNTTMDNLTTDCNGVNSIYSFVTGTSMPLIFYFISSVLLFTSLYHHTVKMKMNSNLSINLEPYYSAMKFVSITFTYSTIYLIGHSFPTFHYYFYCVGIRRSYIVLDILPVLHSSYLIYRTAKLRDQMSKVLQNVIGFLFQRKDHR